MLLVFWWGFGMGAKLGVIVLISLMVLTGLTMSPGFDAILPGLLDLFGGRQSARTLHFICASLVVAFIIVHLLMVVLAGTAGATVPEVSPPDTHEDSRLEDQVTR